MPPSEGEETSARLAQSLRHRRHAYTHTYEFVIAVHHDAHIIELKQPEIHVDIIGYLLVGERAVTVKPRIGLVDELEKSLAILFLDLLGRLELDDAQIILLEHNLRDTGHLLRQLVGYRDAKLYPVGILSVTHTLHV